MLQIPASTQCVCQNLDSHLCGCPGGCSSLYKVWLYCCAVADRVPALLSRLRAIATRAPQDPSWKFLATVADQIVVAYFGDNSSDIPIGSMLAGLRCQERESGSHRRLLPKCALC